MTRDQTLHGVLTALATPFDAEGRIDVPALRQVIDRSIDGGVHGVVAGGSTGEFAALSESERMRLVDEVTAHVDGRVPVIAQTGAVTTAEALRHTRAAEEAGADVLMVVTPYYEPLTEAETVDYLRRVAESTQLPIMLYNIPGATGVTLTPQIAGRLAEEHEHIRCMKDSSADWQLGLELIRGLGDRLEIFIGWDVYALSALTEGAAGIMAGTANVVPRQLVSVHDAVLAGEHERARREWDRLYPLFESMMSGSFVAAVKAGLELQGVPVGDPRHPMAPLDEARRRELARLLAALEAPAD